MKEVGVVKNESGQRMIYLDYVEGFIGKWAQEVKVEDETHPRHLILLWQDLYILKPPKVF